MNPRARHAVAVILSLIALLLIRRRPVRGPELAGDWRPAPGKPDGPGE